MMNKIMIGAVIIVILAGAGFFYFQWQNKGETVLKTSSYACDGGKTFEATFYTDKVILNLDDGRKFSLPEIPPAFGSSEHTGRFANSDQSFVFRADSDTVSISEGPQQNDTYQNCEVAVAGEEALGTYASTTFGISIKYPRTYTVDAAYAYDQFGPKKLIHGVKFIIPMTVATGTNLSGYDTGISVEQLPRAKNCTGDIYLQDDVKPRTVSESGVSYSVAQSSGAGAGNLYEEMVYAIASSSPCTAVRYFLHSSNIGNYELGAVREFDRTALLKGFDRIRKSLVLTK